MTRPATGSNYDESAPHGFDPDKVRWDFPILNQTVHDQKRLAYLDNAATSQKPVHVIQALRDYYDFYNSNVHRALHYLAERATVAYEEARRVVASFIGSSDPSCLVFTRGTTESINLVAYSWGRASISEGDEILLTEMEHHSNLVPWQILAQECGATLKFIPVREDGVLDLDPLPKLLGRRTRLVAVTHMSNVLGTVNPVEQIIEAAHAEGARVLLDGAQSAPHLPVHVRELDVDFYAFSAHKMLGPMGIGGLYAKKELLEQMPPFHGGGEMISKVELERSTYADVPHKFEAGTPNVAGAIGWGVAVEYLRKLGMDAVRSHDESLTRYTMDQLSGIKGLTLFGRAPRRGGSISFTLEGIHPHDLTQVVDREGVAIRGGHMCCQPLMRRLGVVALSRASLYVYNTKEDINQMVSALERAREFFKHDEY